MNALERFVAALLEIAPSLRPTADRVRDVLVYIHAENDSLTPLSKPNGDGGLRKSSKGHGRKINPSSRRGRLRACGLSKSVDGYAAQKRKELTELIVKEASGEFSCFDQRLDEFGIRVEEGYFLKFIVGLRKNHVIINC